MEPTKIFQIIAMSKEYDTIGKELKKILAQVNIYGYDLLTALTNVAKDVSNKRLSELLLGLATNISSGGSLKIYLEKKAETYLIDYKLSRKEYIEMAGTFMDIYISILIAAPLIMMLMFIIMSVSGLNVGGLSIQSLLFLTVGVVVMLNIVFIFVLNLKQPVV
jgi:flagellar protein FlaJ